MLYIHTAFIIHHTSLCLCGHRHSAHWAWNGYQLGLGSIPRPGKINCSRITGVHALTAKRGWRCPLWPLS